MEWVDEWCHQPGTVLLCAGLCVCVCSYLFISVLCLSAFSSFILVNLLLLLKHGFSCCLTPVTQASLPQLPSLPSSQVLRQGLAVLLCLPHCVAQAGLKFIAPCFHPPKCWVCRVHHYTWPVFLQHLVALDSLFWLFSPATILFYFPQAPRALLPSV